MPVPKRALDWLQKKKEGQFYFEETDISLGLQVVCGCAAKFSENNTVSKFRMQNSKRSHTF